MAEPTCLIWSIEHGAWWCPDACGYTRNVNEAGLYTVERAQEIVDSFHPDGPHEVAIEASVGRAIVDAERARIKDLMRELTHGGPS